MKPAILAIALALPSCGPRVAAPPVVVGAATPSQAETLCLAAVKETTAATGAFSIIGSGASASGTTVLIEVPGATAPWSCRVTPDGVVEETMFTGDEGYL